MFQALLDAIAHMTLSTDAQRVFHGRGGRHPGCEQWTLDLYPPVCLLTSYQAVSPDELAPIEAALQARWAQLCPGEPLNLVFQHRDEVRAHTELRQGTVPEPHTMTEHGSRFNVHLLRGFNHGLFLDMAEGRRWVREHVAAHRTTASSFKVLNLFAYTCAFSVAALQGGASQVINVDMASGPLSIGRQNHQLNGVQDGATFLAHDIFNSWGKINRLGPYDLVIMDPPAYQKGSFIAEKDYARLMRRLPDLLAPGGHALLCLNSPKLGPDFLMDQMAIEAPNLRYVTRLRNPEAFADATPDRALKVLVYQAVTAPPCA
ncbi:MAG: class I SAM-dependent methyltransferase [Aquabacterium sp.]|uniref:class I SAM-dependent methyltransferase n=1 Tax=Aquabacterium sp. TaxID=1872578 RepID=UPI003BE23F16